MALVVDEISIDSENMVKFTIKVGDTVQLCPPIAYPPFEFTGDGVTADYYRNGFVILDQELGKFQTDPPGNMCVSYKHEISGKQIIQYVSRALGEKVFYVVLDGVQIHDHGSIFQGGPAFATYFAEGTPEGTGT